MSIQDLNNAADFARATMSPVASILQALTGRDPKEWDIFEGSYNGVKFHIFESKEAWQGAVDQITDQGGRRKVKYMFPYKDGQTTDDLGRAPDSFSINIMLHGNNYLAGANRLFAELNKPTPGELIHPVLGQITCVMESYTRLHESRSRKAVVIQLNLIEHNFTIGEFRSDIDSSAKGALARALDLLKTVDNAITNITGAIIFANNIKQEIVALLAVFKSDSQATLQRMNKTFNPGTSVDIPTLLPVNEGGSGTDFFPSAVSPNDPFASADLDALSDDTALAVAQTRLQKEVNALRAQISIIIARMSAGRGSLEFYDDILGLKNAGILLQDALEKGIASSRTKIIDYTLPRIMSVREVAFANGLSPDDVEEIQILNPSLLSTNYIEKGATVKVPVSI